MIITVHGQKYAIISDLVPAEIKLDLEVMNAKQNKSPKEVQEQRELCCTMLGISTGNRVEFLLDSMGAWYQKLPAHLESIKKADELITEYGSFSEVPIGVVLQDQELMESFFDPSKSTEDDFINFVIQEDAEKAFKQFNDEQASRSKASVFVEVMGEQKFKEAIQAAIGVQRRKNYSIYWTKR